MCREIRIELTEDGNPIELDEHDIAMMYVTPYGLSEPSVNECKIDKGTIVYQVMDEDVALEGFTTMQLKVTHTNADAEPGGAYISPKFRLEIVEGTTDDSAAEGTNTYTALEAALIRANAVYNRRLESIVFTDEMVFVVTYADGTTYESDVLAETYTKCQEIIEQWELLQHYVDEAKIYMTATEAIKQETQLIKEDTELIRASARSYAADALLSANNAHNDLEELRRGALYTTFAINLETGDLEYESVNFVWSIDYETGNLEFETIESRTVEESEEE